MTAVKTPAGLRGRPTWEIAHLFPYQGAWSDDEYLALNSNQVIFRQPVVVVCPSYRHECLRLIGGPKQLFARDERNGAICGPVALKQRTMIADNLSHGVELGRWNQPRQLRVVDVGNTFQGRECALKYQAARGRVSGQSHDDSAAERFSHQQHRRILDPRRFRQFGTSRFRIEECSFHGWDALAASITAVIEHECCHPCSRLQVLQPGGARCDVTRWNLGRSVAHPSRACC